MLSGSFDSTMCVWNVASGERVRCIELSQVTDVAFSPDGTYALSGGQEVVLWSTADWSATHIFEQQSWMYEVAFSADGQSVIGVDAEGVHWWDVMSGTAIRHAAMVDIMTEFIADVTFTRDGTQVLLAIDDGTLRLLDSASGEELRRLAGDPSSLFGISSIALSPEGTYAVANSFDTALRLWDVETGEELLRFGEAADSLGYQAIVAFGSDSTTALTGDTDGTLRLWDIATGELVSIYEPASE
jgi:WD40 repeat protein